MSWQVLITGDCTKPTVLLKYADVYISEGLHLRFFHLLSSPHHLSPTSPPPLFHLSSTSHPLLLATLFNTFVENTSYHTTQHRRGPDLAWALALSLFVGGAALGFYTTGTSIVDVGLTPGLTNLTNLVCGQVGLIIFVILLILTVLHLAPWCTTTIPSTTLPQVGFDVALYDAANPALFVKILIVKMGG